VPVGGATVPLYIATLRMSNPIQNKNQHQSTTILHYNPQHCLTGFDPKRLRSRFLVYYSELHAKPPAAICLYYLLSTTSSLFANTGQRPQTPFCPNIMYRYSLPFEHGYEQSELGLSSRRRHHHLLSISLYHAGLLRVSAQP
jgi:hypothetical protein